MKKIPLRSCIVTKEKLPKKDLIRIVKNKDNELMIDLTGKINGHGVYIKKDISVINKAITHKIIEKKLEIEIPEELYKQLLEMGE